MIFQRRDFLQTVLGGAVTLGAWPLTSGLARAEENAQAILRTSDVIRNPQVSFAVNVELMNYENGALTGKTAVTTLSRQEDRKFQTLVHINAPSVDRGKILLRNGNILWMYDPSSRASVRISPRQRLLGNASNGDVVTSNLVDDYTPTLVGSEQIADGDKAMKNCFKLRLASNDSSTPYGAIDFWIDSSNSRPIKGRYYTSSGALIKVAWYRSWQQEMGAVRPTEVVIVDGFDPKKITVMKMNGFRPKELPASWFRKEWLPQFEM